MIKLVSKIRFLDGGAMIDEGEIFSVSNEALAQEYILRDLAHYADELQNPNTAAEAESIEEEGYIDYGRMTVVELREIAKELGIEGVSKLNKSELIGQIEEAKRYQR